MAVPAAPHLPAAPDSDVKGRVRPGDLWEDGIAGLRGAGRAAWASSLVVCLIVWASLAVTVYELLS
ncbi:MAG TPA: hypothetical protein VK304_10965 [Thermoleophilaceae bacterium]|nr:hypothetical protein [Thermoleophilaceae bacterium]